MTKKQIIKKTKRKPKQDTVISGFCTMRDIFPFLDKSEDREIPPPQYDPREVAFNKGSTLQEAHDLTRNGRKATHGSFDDNFTRAAAIFNAWEGGSGITICKQDVCKVMIALKMARMQQNPVNRDNYVDMEGYTDLLYLMESNGEL